MAARTRRMFTSSSTMRTWATAARLPRNQSCLLLSPSTAAPEPLLGARAPRLPVARLLLRRARPGRLGGALLAQARQRDEELGALARRGADDDRPLVRLHDALADREPEAGPLLLRRVERDEDALAGVLGDARAGVAEPDLDDVGAARALAPEGELVARDARRDGEAPAAGHRLEGVEREVQEDLLQLLGVGLHVRHPLGEVEVDLHVRRGEALEEPERLLEDVVHRGGRERGLERAGVVEELGDDAVQPVHLLDHDLDELAVLGGELRGIEVLDRALDGGEGGADLVGEAGGHLAE